MVGLVEPMKNSKIDENLEKEIIKIPRAADFDKPKELSKTDEHLGEEIVEISCPHCREEIPQSQNIEHIEMCKQALKHISDLLCLKCDTKFQEKFKIFRHVKLHHLDDDEFENNEIVETLENPVRQQLTTEVITISSDSDSDMDDEETNDNSECNVNFQIKSEVFLTDVQSTANVETKVNSPNIAKGLFGGFDNSALPVYYKSYSSNQFAKEIPMIENDESEDESLIEFKDLSFSKDLLKLYDELIVKVSEENKQSGNVHDEIQKELPNASKKRPFLNGGVGNDDRAIRKSIVDENILDDLPKIVGFHCNPNATPLIKKNYNSKAIEEHEKANENVLVKKCPLCQFSVQTRIEQHHEDLNNHLENCEKFQKIFKKPKKYCPLCQREPKSSLVFHMKSKHFRDILGGSDSSDSSSESSEHSDTDNIIIISDSDDNDSIDSGVQNDTNDFTSTLTKYLQRNQKKNDKSIIGQPIPETQNHETENIIPLELFHEDEVKEPKPLIIFYYECPITSGKCQKWRSIEDVYAHVEAYHRMPKNIFEKTGLKIPEKILK